MWTCDNGHAISPGEEFCRRCGAYVRPDDLSGSPEEVARPGSDPGPGQAEHATEYSDDPFAEYTSAYSSGSFTEFIAATSEADIPPFSPEPLPDAMAPGAYDHPAPDAPGLAHLTFTLTDNQRRAPRSTASRMLPATRRRAPRSTASRMLPATLGWTPTSGVPDGPGDPAPDAWGQDEPAAPSGGAPDAFGRSGLSSPDQDQSGLYGRGESGGSGKDLSGDGADTPVSGFHAMIRLPAAPAAERPSPPSARPSPPSDRIEWAPHPSWTTPPAEERISTPGEWHIPSRPAGSASGGLASGPTAAAGSTGHGSTGNGSTGHGSTGHGSAGHGAGGAGTLAAPRVEDEDDEGPDTAVGRRSPATRWLMPATAVPAAPGCWPR